MKNKKQQALEVLRQRAEDLLSGDENRISDKSSAEIKRVLQELELYHLELEMQNDELQQASTNSELQKLEFANLFELAPIGYIVIDKAAVITDANNAALQLLGVDKPYVQHRPFLLHVLREDTDPFYLFYNKLLLSPQSLSCTIRMQNARKQVLTVKISGIALKHGTEDVFCYLTLTDITEKQQAEQRLKEAKTRLEIALNASFTGIWEIDITTGKVFLDDFCRTLYGFDTLAFDGKYDTLLSRIHPKDRKNLELNIRQTMVAEKSLFVRFRAFLPDQKIKYIQARAQVITDQADKKSFIGTFTDISEKMILELETARTREENQQMILAAGLQAEENEKKRVSEILHDGIAQMLYAIKLNINQVNKASELPAFEHITELLNQSIKEIRNISFELTPFILMDYGLADTLEDMAARLSGKQLSISTSVIDFGKSHSIQLQLNIFRIVQELVNNAIKHGSPGKIGIEVVKKNKVVTVMVTDDGVGFKTETDATISKGIGLSSIKNRLRLYNGTIRIGPNPEGGTIVSIVLKISKHHPDQTGKLS